MTRETVIVGVGGMAREAAAWLQDVIAVDDSGRFLGFVDDDPAVGDRLIDGRPVLGPVGWLKGRTGVRAVVAIGDPATRAHVTGLLAASGTALDLLVHPSAVVGPDVDIAPGSIIGPGVVLTRDITVGTGCIINYGAALGHDCVLGDYVFVGPGVHVAGAVRIGAEASIGIGASIVQGVSIGARTIVGAGASVVGDLPPRVTAVGVPARPRGGPDESPRA